MFSKIRNSPSVAQFLAKSLVWGNLLQEIQMQVAISIINSALIEESVSEPFWGDQILSP